MTEPMSDALFGVDGTELPPLSRDPAGRGSWSDVSVPPPVPLPAIPHLNMSREAIAAALGEDPGGAGEQERSATAASPDATASSTATSSAGEPSSSPAAGSGPPGASAPSRQPAAAITTPFSPAHFVQSGPGGPGYLRPASARSLPRVQPRSSRRRVPHLVRGLPVQTRSNGGAGAFFVIAVIVFAILLYFIVSGLVESIARLIP